MLNTIEVGKNIKEMRINLGLSQKNIAEYLNVDQSYVSLLEEGKRQISSDMLEALAALFCCEITHLLSDDVPEAPYKIAFRTTTLGVQELKALAVISRIALNQVQMDRLN